MSTRFTILTGAAGVIAAGGVCLVLAGQAGAADSVHPKLAGHVVSRSSLTHVVSGSPSHTAPPHMIYGSPTPAP